MVKILPSYLRKSLALLLTVAVGVFTLEPLFFPRTVRAATTGYLRLNRMATSAATGGTVCLTPDEVGSEAKVVVTFPGNGTQGLTSFGVNGTAGNWTVDTDDLPTGATAWPGIDTATSVTGAAVTFPTTGMSAATLYCFNFTGTLTLSTPTQAGINLTGRIQTQTAANAPIATVNLATSVVTNEQVLVTASVVPTFSMSITPNTAALGALPNTGAPATANVTMTVSTNALNGWLAWVKNANANSTLTSVTTGDTSISSGAFTTGVGNIHSLDGAPGYGMSAAAGAGTPTIATEYAGSATTFGSLDNTVFRLFASKNTPAASNTVTITFGAEASPTTEAATDYTDTVTITAAGQF